MLKEGSHIGYVRLRKPVEDTEQNNKCVSLSKPRISSTGIFPVYLRYNGIHTHDVLATVSIPATIVEEPGTKCWDIKVSLPLAEAMCLAEEVFIKTGNPNSVDQDWYIFLNLWDDIVNQFEEELEEEYLYLIHSWERRKADGDGKCLSNLSAIRFCGEYIGKFAKNIESIKLVKDFLKRNNWNQPEWAPTDRT
jgi:hypothetical protein